MERKVSFTPSEIYHLYNRGVNKQKIFINDHDRFRLLILFYLCNNDEVAHISNHQGVPLMEYFSIERGEQLVEVIAYCLMPNHFHLIVREKVEKGVSNFMLKVLTGYSMYFNKKHKRTGPIFERPFKAKHIADDAYLEYLLAYVHLNPVKIKDKKSWTGKKISNQKLAKEFLKSYRFSSYQNFLGYNQAERTILDLSFLSKDLIIEQRNIKELIKIWSEDEE